MHHPKHPTARRQRSRAEAVEELAENLRELAAFSGSATEEDLTRIGWTPEELKDFLPDARARAGVHRTAA